MVIACAMCLLNSDIPWKTGSPFFISPKSWPLPWGPGLMKRWFARLRMDSRKKSAPGIGSQYQLQEDFGVIGGPAGLIITVPALKNSPSQIRLKSIKD